MLFYSLKVLMNSPVVPDTGEAEAGREEGVISSRPAWVPNFKTSLGSLLSKGKGKGGLGT